MIRRPPRSTQSRSSAASDVYKRQVLDRLLAQVVVDPEDLLLVEVLPQHRVELPGGFEIVAERLLDDQARPALRGAPLAERFDDCRERGGRDGEVVDAVAAEVVLLIELREQLGELVLTALVGEVGRDV